MTELKTLNIRIPKENWIFIKKKAVDRETSINQIFVELLEKYKNKCEKKLTIDDANVK